MAHKSQLMPSVGFPLKYWRLWHVCLQNKNVCCDIKCDSLQWTRGLQFENSCRQVPVCIKIVITFKIEKYT